MMPGGVEITPPPGRPDKERKMKETFSVVFKANVEFSTKPPVDIDMHMTIYDSEAPWPLITPQGVLTDQGVSYQMYFGFNVFVVSMRMLLDRLDEDSRAEALDNILTSMREHIEHPPPGDLIQGLNMMPS